LEAHFAAGDFEIHNTIEQQLRWREAIVGTQRREPTAAGYEEILTHVGGVSLLFEHSVQPAEVVFSELHSMELEGEVLSTIGRLSLFPEEDWVLLMTNEVCDIVLLEDVAASVLFEKVLQHDDVEWKPRPPPCKVHIILDVLGTMPAWRRSAFSPGNPGI
jgi:hypothetical protein